MANFTKFKWYGYLDLCTSVSQLVVTSTCTLFSLHLEFTRKVEPKQLYFFSPTFNLICTLSILFATLKQVDCARHLIRAGRNYLFIVELAKIRGNWMFWNVINCLLAFIWFPCFGITMFLENDWPLVMILTFFVIIGVNRSILSVGMWKLKVHEVNPRAVPEPGLQQQPVVMSNLQRQDSWM